MCPFQQNTNFVPLAFATESELYCLKCVAASPLQQKMNFIGRHFLEVIRNYALRLIIDNLTPCFVVDILLFILYQRRAEHSLSLGLYQSCVYNGNEEMGSRQILCQCKFISRL
jgi:hypothetical protein